MLRISAFIAAAVVIGLASCGCSHRGAKIVSAASDPSFVGPPGALGATSQVSPADPSLTAVPTTTTVNGNTVTLTKTDDGLEYYDVKIGAGKTAEVGDSVSMQYTGRLLDGTVFDSTAKRSNTPFTFLLGEGHVVRGWDEGIPGMKVGGERILVIPAYLAYGDSPPTSKIPADATLVFDVTLSSVD